MYDKTNEQLMQKYGGTIAMENGEPCHLLMGVPNWFRQGVRVSSAIPCWGKDLLGL